MAMNKQKGNMYGFVTHTWNPIRGRCLHDCVYCYMKKIKGAWDKEAHIVEKEFKVQLGSGNVIFVGSSTDMWGNWIPDKWIKKVIDYCNKFPNNQYLFQSKEPLRFFDVKPSDNFIFCTTAESDKQKDRIRIMQALKRKRYRIAITIEPIMDFNLKDFLVSLWACNPEWIAIGANTSKIKLREPSKQKVMDLINGLRSKHIKLHLKDNLDRLKDKTNKSYQKPIRW